MKSIYWLCLLISQFSFGQLEKLEFGNSGCGFISLTRFDTTRPAVSEQPSSAKGRIIQINLWYPSPDRTVANKMDFGEYVALVGKELDEATADPGQLGREKYFAWPLSQGADQKRFQEFLNKKVPMLAIRNAKWERRNYPLVLLVHGFAADYAYLAEYLASYGYLVLQVPVKGTTTYELDYEGQGLESQVLDYEFAMNFVRKEFAVSSQKVGVAGFSFGGQSALAFALRNKNVKAVLSLDGGIGSAFGAGLLSRQPYYDAKHINQAILHLYNPSDSYTDLGWFSQPVNSHRVLAAMKNMQHGHFTTFGLLNKYIPGIMGKQFEDPGQGYEAVMLTTKEFLDTYLKNKPVTPSRFMDGLYAAHPWTKEYLLKVDIKAAGT